MIIKKLILIICLGIIGLAVGVQKIQADQWCGGSSTCQNNVNRGVTFIRNCRYDQTQNVCVEDLSTTGGYCQQKSSGCPSGAYCCGFYYAGSGMNKYKCGTAPTCQNILETPWYDCCTGSEGGTTGGNSTTVNCSGLTTSGGTTLTKGQTYTLGANYDFTNHLARKERVAWMKIIGGTTCPATQLEYFQKTNICIDPAICYTWGNDGWDDLDPPAPVTFSWTPDTAGTYTIYCGSAAAAQVGCTGFKPPNDLSCDPTNNYVCNGPYSYTTVTVVDTTGTIQGRRVVMPSNQEIEPAKSQTATLPGYTAWHSLTDGAYSFSNVTAGTKTVTVTVPASYSVVSTLCYNGIDCHTASCATGGSCPVAGAYQAGSSRTVDVPGGGYADLWWHYTAPPSCTLALTASPPSIAISGQSALSATVTPLNGTISRVDFDETGGHTTPTSSYDDTPGNGFTSIATGVSSGNSTVTAIATMNDNVTTCTGNSTVTVTNSDPWWQVKDGDVATNGNLDSSIPDTATEPYFDTKGDGGYPGVPAYGTTSTLTGTKISETEWLANSGYNTTKKYDSAYFLNAIPLGTTINSLAGSIDGSAIANGGTATNGIYWYEFDPLQNGGIDLTINTAANLDTRKVILIVKGADVYLKGNINLTKGSGFFLLVAGATAGGSKGNIIVDSGVGGSGPNLEGIYVADGQFRTGTKGLNPPSDDQLWVRGTISAYDIAKTGIGISLQRNLGTANSTTPSELFEFAPDLELLFPETFGARPMSWQEVAP